jgi:hypothetical protein
MFSNCETSPLNPIVNQSPNSFCSQFKLLYVIDSLRLASSVMMTDEDLNNVLNMAVQACKGTVHLIDSQQATPIDTVAIVLHAASLSWIRRLQVTNDICYCHRIPSDLFMRLQYDANSTKDQATPIIPMHKFDSQPESTSLLRGICTAAV